MSGHRKAALALHGLTADDQRAVLAELPEADRRILRAYLDELAELGFEGEAVDVVLAERSPAHPYALVASAAPGDVLDVLRDEPASFIAAVLQVQRWPWEDAVLSALPAALRIRVETQRGGHGRDASARNACVVRLLAQALGGQRTALETVPAMRRFASPFKRIAAWIR